MKRTLGDVEDGARSVGEGDDNESDTSEDGCEEVSRPPKKRRTYVARQVSHTQRHNFQADRLLRHVKPVEQRRPGAIKGVHAALARVKACNVFMANGSSQGAIEGI